MKYMYHVLLGVLLCCLVGCGAAEVPTTDAATTTVSNMAVTASGTAVESTVALPVIEKIEDLVQCADVVSVTSLPDAGEGYVAFEVLFLSGGVQIQADIVVREDYASTDYPVLFYYPEVKTATKSLASTFASRYLAVVRMYERGWGKSEGMRDYAGEDMDDILRMAEILSQTRFFADNKKIVAGSGIGSILALRAAAESDLFHGCAVIDVISDLPTYAEARGASVMALLADGIGKSVEEAPQEYQKRSAVCFAEKFEVPVLMFHYRATPLFPEAQVTALHAALQRAGKVSEVYYMDGLSADFNAEAVDYLVSWIRAVK